MCVFYYPHEIKFSQLNCMKGIVFMSVERFLFSLDFLISLLRSHGGRLLMFFYIESSSVVPCACPSTSPLIKGRQPIFCQLLACTIKAEAQFFVSPPLQNFSVNTARVLNQLEQRWVQHRLTSLFFQLTEWILQLELCSVLPKTDCCHCPVWLVYILFGYIPIAPQTHSAVSHTLLDTV